MILLNSEKSDSDNFNDPKKGLYLQVTWSFTPLHAVYKTENYEVALHEVHDGPHNNNNSTLIK